MMLRMDPRCKLYLLLLANLMLFYHVNTRTECVMTLLFILPLFLAGKNKSGIRFLAIYSVMLAMNIFLIPVADGILLHLIALLSVGIRMMLPCLISGVYAFSTTTPSELFCALRKWHVPEGIIITCAVVIRFFPTVAEDYRQIRHAMMLRGISIGVRHPMQSLEYVLIPLLMNGSTVAQDLSVAALTKGLGIRAKHTSMTEIHMRWCDCAYMLIATVPLALFLGGVL